MQHAFDKEVIMGLSKADFEQLRGKKVRFHEVSVFPDVKVQYTDRFPDFKVRITGVKSGSEAQVIKVMTVDKFPDVKLQQVDRFQDFEIYMDDYM